MRLQQYLQFLPLQLRTILIVVFAAAGYGLFVNVAMQAHLPTTSTEVADATPLPPDSTPLAPPDKFENREPDVVIDPLELDIEIIGDDTLWPHGENDPLVPDWIEFPDHVPVPEPAPVPEPEPAPDKWIVIIVGGPNCSHCVQAKTYFTELQKTEDFELQYVDKEEWKKNAPQETIRSIPVIYFFKLSGETGMTLEEKVVGFPETLKKDNIIIGKRT